MDQHLNDLDAQLADIEAEIAAQPNTKAGRMTAAALYREHEQLVARVQRWTVGSQSPLEVG